MKPACPVMSVIVPVFNRASLIMPTLRSLEAQTAVPIEIILIDNNSTDGSYELLKEWSAKAWRRGFDIIVDRCAKPGASAARNAGFALASASWVMFFDSDDIMPPGHVADALEAIRNNPDADIIGWDYISRNGEKRRLNRFFGCDMMWNNLFHGAMSSARWCARASLVRRAGAWNEDVRYWDDIELGARMLALGPKIVYRGLSGVEVLDHADSISASYMSDPARIEPALNSIAATLGQSLWPDIKRAIEYGLSSRAGNKLGLTLQRRLTAGKPLRQRLLLSFAYHHTRLGLRGAARLLKPFANRQE